jgi:hypothetical protein
VTDEFVYCVDVTCLGILPASAVDKHETKDRACKSFAMTLATIEGIQEVIHEVTEHKHNFLRRFSTATQPRSN